MRFLAMCLLTSLGVFATIELIALGYAYGKGYSHPHTVHLLVSLGIVSAAFTVGILTLIGNFFLSEG